MREDDSVSDSDVLVDEDGQHVVASRKVFQKSTVITYMFMLPDDSIRSDRIVYRHGLCYVGVYLEERVPQPFFGIGGANPHIRGVPNVDVEMERAVRLDGLPEHFMVFVAKASLGCGKSSRVGV